MKNNIIILAFLSFCFCCTLSAQQTTPIRTSKSTLGLSAGYNYGWFKDTNYSPLIYTSKGRLFALTYEHEGKKGNLFQAQLSYSGGEDTTPFSDSFMADFWQGDIELAWLKKLNVANPKTDLYLGGQYHFDLNMNIFIDTDYAFTFLFAHRFELKTKLNHQINQKNSFHLSAAIPVASYVVRPPYTGYDDDLDANQDKYLKLVSTNGDWRTFNKYFAIKFNAGYNYQLTERIGTSINYDFNFQKESQFKQAQHQVKLGLNYKF